MNETYQHHDVDVRDVADVTVDVPLGGIPCVIKFVTRTSTHAVLFHRGEEVANGTSILNPGDEYDMITGYKIALGRLFEGLEKQAKTNLITRIIDSVNHALEMKEQEKKLALAKKKQEEHRQEAMKAAQGAIDQITNEIVDLLMDGNYTTANGLFQSLNNFMARAAPNPGGTLGRAGLFTFDASGILRSID